MKLAEHCDSSTGYIGQIEIGNKFPSIEMIDKMAAALNIKPYMLFLDEADLENLPAAKEPQIGPKTDKDNLIYHLTASIRQVVRRYY